MATISVAPDNDIDAIRVNISDGGSSNVVYRRPQGSSLPWLRLGTVSGANTHYMDREAMSGVPYTYRVHDGTSYSSQHSTSVSYNRWWMRHLSNSSRDLKNLFIDNDPLEIGSKEEQAVFGPLARTTPIVIKDKGIKAARFDINIQFMGEQPFADFVYLRSLQTTLLLQSPMAVQWYFVFDSDARERVHNTTSAYRHMNIGLIEVERPHHEDL